MVNSDVPRSAIARDIKKQQTSREAATFYALRATRRPRTPSRAETKTIQQCRSCPWRVDCEPLTDIPNGYSVELHEGLRGTIAQPGSIHFNGCQRMMACHYSKVGEEIPCAGWLYHQRGVGNNIAVRIQMMRGDLPVPIVDGEQHQTFDDTLPECERALMRIPRVAHDRTQHCPCGNARAGSMTDESKSAALRACAEAQEVQ